ncbi:hypothetical protein TNCV_4052071 [Trichonephila clavipes]|nr:hypothetical protein TNCV_4052071 [Trichonephila clavipes]
MASTECIGGPWAPTPQRCRVGSSVSRQCVPDGCGSEIQYHPKPRYRLRNQQKRNSSVQIMSFHSVVHVCPSSNHLRRKRLWFPVKGKRNNGRLEAIPL